MTESWEIGMMHPAYQTGRTVLVDWINDNFDVKYKKVEDCATGAIYCQMLDAIYPKNNHVKMNKVEWGKNTSDNKKLDNWKMVQKCLTKNGVSKPIDVGKLIKAKFQDNIEFLQWFAHFFNCKYGGTPYHAKLRRANKKTPKNCETVLQCLEFEATSKSTSKRVVKVTESNKKKVMPKTQGNKKKKPKEKNEVKSSEEKQKLTQNLEAVEKERNFYFSKLREIEILCQETQEENVDKLKDSVKKILYKTDEDGDMVVPDEGDDDDDKQDDGEEVSIDPDADETTF